MKLSADDFHRVAKALADPQRLEILRHAAKGELRCSDLLERFPIAQPTISHHLKELTSAGLLVRRKEGKCAFYSFVPDVLEAYTRQLNATVGLAAR